MRDIKDLCARIEDELSKIADNGLTDHWKFGNGIQTD